MAAMSEEDAVVEVLLRWGADPNAVTDLGSTPLHVATSPLAAKHLIQYGADVMAADHVSDEAKLRCT
jgi:ankyrin repeat protein